jgi:hypothetical protein
MCRSRGISEVPTTNIIRKMDLTMPSSPDQPTTPYSMADRVTFMIVGGIALVAVLAFFLTG